jgi:hypothetical protein
MNGYPMTMLLVVAGSTASGLPCFFCQSIQCFARNGPNFWEMASCCFPNIVFGYISLLDLCPNSWIDAATLCSISLLVLPVLHTAYS